MHRSGPDAYPVADAAGRGGGEAGEQGGVGQQTLAHHDAVRLGALGDVQRLVVRPAAAVREDRHVHGRLDQGDGVVVGRFRPLTDCSAVNSDVRDAGRFELDTKVSKNVSPTFLHMSTVSSNG